MRFDVDKWVESPIVGKFLWTLGKSAAAWPEEKGPEPLWRRSARTLGMFIDIAILLTLVSCFFTWHDLREQPASAWPRRADFAFFMFCTGYGFVRVVRECFRMLSVKGGNAVREWVGILLHALGISAMIFYATVSPPGLLVRLSAAFDQSKATRKKFKVIAEHSRRTPSRTSDDVESYYYTITNPDDPKQHQWEVYIGRPEPEYSVPPSFWVLSYHHSTFGVDWIDRSDGKPVYEFDRFIDYTAKELSTMTLAFVYLDSCYSSEIDVFFQKWLEVPNRELFMIENFRYQGESNCEVNRPLSAPHRGFDGAYLQTVSELLPETAFLRCPDGRLQVFSIGVASRRQDFLHACEQPSK